MEWLNSSIEFIVNSEIFISIIKANWIEIIIGALVGAFIAGIGNIYKLIKSILYDSFKGYYGTYYLYGYYLLQPKTSHNVNEVFIEVRKNYFGNPKVNWIDNEYRYKGFMHIHDKNIYIFVQGTTHKEEQLLITGKPLIAPQFTISYAIKACVTNHYEPAASINILTKIRLEEKEVTEMLGQNKTIILNEKSSMKKLNKYINTHTSLSRSHSLDSLPVS